MLIPIELCTQTNLAGLMAGLIIAAFRIASAHLFGRRAEFRRWTVLTTAVALCVAQALLGGHLWLLFAPLMFPWRNSTSTATQNRWADRSHELRGPLSAVVTSGRSLLDEQLTPGQRDR